jgi:hypothetical protein
MTKQKGSGLVGELAKLSVPVALVLAREGIRSRGKTIKNVRNLVNRVVKGKKNQRGGGLVTDLAKLAIIPGTFIVGAHYMAKKKNGKGNIMGTATNVVKDISNTTIGGLKTILKKSQVVLAPVSGLVKSTTGLVKKTAKNIGGLVTGKKSKRSSKKSRRSNKKVGGGRKRRAGKGTRRNRNKRGGFIRDGSIQNWVDSRQTCNPTNNNNENAPKPYGFEL